MVRESVAERMTERRRFSAVFILLASLSFSAYANSVTGDFVFDDVKIVKVNPNIRSFGEIPKILRDMFTHRRLAREGMKVDTGYRPVRYISYVLDYQLTAENPIGYHISNIIYHIIVSFLLFILLLRLGAGFFGATTAAALFCIHPVNSETVIYITARKEILCALFFLASFLAYLSYRDHPSVTRLLLMIFLFIFALFSKEMALSFFGLLLVFELLKSGWSGSISTTLRTLFDNIKRRRLLLPILSVFVISFAYGLYAIYIKNPAGLGEEWVGYWGGSLINSLLSIGRAFVFYIRLIVFPYPLSADYSYDIFPPSTGILTPATTLPSILLHLGVIASAVFMFIRRKFVVPFAILFFYTSLAPVSQVFPTPERIAERFLYIPMFAFAVLIAFGLKGLQKRRMRPPVYALFLLFPLYFFLVVHRSSDWRNNETLFASVLSHYPDCARAHFAVGAAKAERNDLDGALMHFNRVLELLPPEKQRGWLKGYVLNARRGRASVLLNSGRVEEAVEELKSLINERDVFGRVMGEVPEFLHLHLDLGRAYFRMKRYSDAEAEYRRVLELAPKVEEIDTSFYVSEAEYRIGRIKSAEGLHSEAVDWFHRAADRTPDKRLRLQMLFHEALALYDSARFRSAFSLFESVSALADELMEGESGGEIETVFTAKRQSELMMARALKHLGDLKGALQLLRRLKRRYPDWWLLYYEEAQLFLSLESYSKAEGTVREALSFVSDEKAVEAFKELLALIAVKRGGVERREGLSERLTKLLKAAKEMLRRGRRKEAEGVLKDLLSHRVSVPAGEEDSFYPLAEAQLLLLENGMVELDGPSLAEARRLVSLSARLCSVGSSGKAYLFRRLAALYEKAEESDGALFCWQKVVENNPDYLGAHFHLALLLLGKKDYETALKHFKESVRQGYLIAESYYYIGKIHYRRRDYEAARKNWLEFLKHAGDADIEKVREVGELLNSDPHLKNIEGR